MASAFSLREKHMGSFIVIFAFFYLIMHYLDNKKTGCVGEHVSPIRSDDKSVQKVKKKKERVHRHTRIIPLLSPNRQDFLT